MSLHKQFREILSNRHVPLVHVPESDKERIIRLCDDPLLTQVAPFLPIGFIFGAACVTVHRLSQLTDGLDIKMEVLLPGDAYCRGGGRFVRDADHLVHADAPHTPVYEFMNIRGAEVSGFGWLALGLVAICNDRVLVRVRDPRPLPRWGGGKKKRSRPTEYTVIDAAACRERWKSDPSNRGNVIPHLRRAHLRRLASGRVVQVRSTMVHRDEFSWSENGKRYVVVPR